MRRIAFIGGMVFNSEKEEFAPATVLCESGYITDIIEDDFFTPCDYEIVDLEGKYLIPGLIDVHTHGIGNYDFNYATESEIPFMCAKYAKAGTTSIMATLASDTISRYMNSIFAINQNRLHARSACANILGIHLEGRYLNPEMKGAHAIELLANPNADELASLALSMMPPPLHVSVAPELSGADEFIKKATELGATVGIAHTASSYEQAKRALSLGAKSFTHTFNAMTKVHHRMPGAAICALTSDEAYAEIIADGEHLHPAIVELAYKTKPKDKLVLITDSMCATCVGDGKYGIAGSIVYVKDGRATNENGVLAGSTLTMFNALRNMMKFCKIPLKEAIKYATTNPAKMVGADFVGKIAKCYRADFIAIKDVYVPEIDTVYVGGQRVIAGMNTTN